MIRQLMYLIVIFSSITNHLQGQNKNFFFQPQAIWEDCDGNPINAHGGGILKYNKTYYWYGEYKTGPTTLPSWATWECYRTDAGGVSCYSSKDLLNWHFEGIVLKPESDPASDLHPSKVIERPKVVYNKKTGKFVMWFHCESADYSKAAAGVAISDSPIGQFKYLGSFRPNGSMSRDQTLFVDDDEVCYQICSSEDNQTLHINRLTEDYLKPDGTFKRCFVGESREAPALFKYNNNYYMLTSGCTGWDPNQAELAVAKDIMGDWTTIGNPCTGNDADKTFYGQSTFVIPVNAVNGEFIACFDMWKKKDLADSRYIWLPVKINRNTGSIKIPWMPTWKKQELKKWKNIKY